MLIGLVSCGALFVLVVLVGALTSPKDATVTAVDGQGGVATTTTAPPTTTALPTTTAPPTTAAPAETAGQRNARRSAENYLDTMPFSRAGLIDQLASPYGGKFSHDDAVYGVDALNADWNEQAVRAAKNYLDTMPFSREGLIDQLASPHGGKFTHDQAVYGVNGAGL